VVGVFGVRVMVPIPGNSSLTGARSTDGVVVCTVVLIPPVFIPVFSAEVAVGNFILPPA